MTSLDLAMAKNEARAEIEALARTEAERKAMEHGMIVLADILESEL